MFKKLILVIAVLVLAMNLSGCVAAMVLMAENAEAKQTLEMPYSQAIDIVKAAIRSLDIEFLDAKITKNIAEAKAKYPDGKTVRIYVHEIGDNQCDVSVRAGFTEAGKEEAQRILQAIMKQASNTLNPIN